MRREGGGRQSPSQECAAEFRSKATRREKAEHHHTRSLTCSTHYSHREPQQKRLLAGTKERKEKKGARCERYRSEKGEKTISL